MKAAVADLWWSKHRSCANSEAHANRTGWHTNRAEQHTLGNSSNKPRQHRTPPLRVRRSPSYRRGVISPFMGLYFSYTFLASDMEVFIHSRATQMPAEQWIKYGLWHTYRGASRLEYHSHSPCDLETQIHGRVRHFTETYVRRKGSDLHCPGHQKVLVSF